MIYPNRLERRIISDRFSGGLRAPDKTYDVLEEMTEMWWQAAKREIEVVESAVPESFKERIDYLSELAKLQGKRMVWEEAIAIYAGWNGTQLAIHLDQAMTAKKEAASV